MITIYCSRGGDYVELQARTEEEMAELQKVADFGHGKIVERVQRWMRVQIPQSREA